jgi:hypothetical protein
MTRCLLGGVVPSRSLAQAGPPGPDRCAPSPASTSYMKISVPLMGSVSWAPGQGSGGLTTSRGQLPSFRPWRLWRFPRVLRCDGREPSCGWPSEARSQVHGITKSVNHNLCMAYHRCVSPQPHFCGLRPDPDRPKAGREGWRLPGRWPGLGGRRWRHDRQEQALETEAPTSLRQGTRCAGFIGRCAIDGAGDGVTA